MTVSHSVIEWEMLRTEDGEKTKTYILCSVAFFLQISCHLWDHEEEYSRTRQARDDTVCAFYAG
jgi:hypothetical protein